jgi:hypothetical protein
MTAYTLNRRLLAMTVPYRETPDSIRGEVATMSALVEN